MKGVKAKIHMEAEETPKFFKARTVPYAMRAKTGKGVGPVVGNARSSRQQGRWTSTTMWRLQSHAESKLQGG